ncbi:MAG TPA: hypothetical protein PKW95_08435 [bacterium]|nr:hypothetical protein [bacterium]
MEKSVEFVLSLPERDFVLREAFAVEESILRKLRLAEVVQGGIRVSLSLEEMDLFLGGLAFEANHAKNNTLEKMFDAVFSRLAAQFDQTPEAENGPFPDMQAMMEVMEVLGGERPLTNPDLLSPEKNPQLEYVTTPMDSLGGLSAAQAQDLCNRGWWDDDAQIRLNVALSDEDLKDAVFLHNARMLLNAVEEDGGAPLTAKGNLTRAFVAKLMDRLIWDGKELELIRMCNTVINEQNAMSLHILRLVCQEAKLVKKVNKKLVATKLGRRLSSPENGGEFYAALFDGFFNKLNLAYLDSLPDDGDAVQGLFPYSLYRLSLLNPAWDYVAVDLTDAMLPPPLVDHLGSYDEWTTADDYIQCRVLRPLVHFGLLDLRGERTIKSYLEDTATYRKTALFDKFFLFNVNT